MHEMQSNIMSVSVDISGIRFTRKTHQIKIISKTIVPCSNHQKGEWLILSPETRDTVDVWLVSQRHTISLCSTLFKCHVTQTQLLSMRRQGLIGSQDDTQKLKEEDISMPPPTIPSESSQTPEIDGNETLLAQHIVMLEYFLG